jgi:hypothetical protein
MLTGQVKSLMPTLCSFIRLRLVLVYVLGAGARAILYFYFQDKVHFQIWHKNKGITGFFFDG